MKQKKLSVIIAFLLLSSMSLSMIVSVKAGDDTYTYNYDETYFEYDVKEGDSFEYDFLFDVNFTASNTFYDEMDTWIVDMAADEGITLVDFSLEDIVEDVENITNLDYAIKLEITEMYSKFSNYTNYYDDGWETKYYDIFNASVRVDLNEGDGWETPEVIVVDKLEQAKIIAENYLNATEYDDFEEEIDDYIDEVEDEENQPDWDNLEIYQVQSDRFYYYENGTQIVDVPKELANGTTEPANPFPDFDGPNGVPLFFPTEMNFEEFYEYATDLFKFELLYEIEMGHSVDPLVSTDTLQSVLTKGGVSEIHVDEKSIGFIWDLDNVDEEFLEELVPSSSMSEPDDFGIDDYTGSVAFAAEYDKDWALATFVIYAHIGLTLDTTGIEDAPDLTNEDISIDITYTLARDGVNPPTEENIVEGKIGQSRAFEIPGFPIWLVGLFGLISVAALVVKHRK